MDFTRNDVGHFWSPKNRDVHIEEIDDILEVYAYLVDASSQNDGYCFQFEAISKNWFDENPYSEFGDAGPKAQRFAEYHDVTPVFKLELSCRENQFLEYCIRFSEVGWFYLKLKRATGEVADVENARASVCDYLYEAGENYVLDSYDRVGDSRELDLSLSTDGVIDIISVEHLLELIPVDKEIDSVVVYDVGQGNSIGVNIPKCDKQIHFDFGCGVYGNAKTYPNNRIALLDETCDTVIILSHWHEDHWGGVGKAPNAFNATWIVPQHETKHVQSKLIAGIIRNGGVICYLDPMWLNSTAWHGCFFLEKCTGSNTNDAGLALTISQNPEGDGHKILMPGDSSYGCIESILPVGNYLHLIASHHGASAKGAPKPTDNEDGILAVSVGVNNSYEHPNKDALEDYAIRGWYNPRVKMTSNRVGECPCDIVLSWPK